MAHFYCSWIFSVAIILPWISLTIFFFNSLLLLSFFTTFHLIALKILKSKIVYCFNWVYRVSFYSFFFFLSKILAFTETLAVLNFLQLSALVLLAEGRDRSRVTRGGLEYGYKKQKWKPILFMICIIVWRQTILLCCKIEGNLNQIVSGNDVSA